MGAYLHIIDGLPDSFTDRESIRYLNEMGTRSGGRSYPSTRELASSVRVANREESPSASYETGECSSFWAGQLDDCFEDLRVRRMESSIPGPAGRKGYSTREGRMGRNPGESPGYSNGVIARRDLYTMKGQNVSSFVASSSKNSGEVTEQRSADSCNARIEGERDENSATCDMWAEIDCGLHTLGAKLLTDGKDRTSGILEDADLEDATERLPDHLLTEIVIRVPVQDWAATASVKKRWAQLFRGDGLWHSALLKEWPRAALTKRWPGPISRGSSKRRYTALHVSDTIFKDKLEGIDEVAGHVYLFLKEQLESSTPPASYGLLHGTIIDQFLACGKTGDEAYELASHTWVAVLDNLDESETTFHLLLRIAEEWETFLPYPYTKSNAVQWRLFERLFTDFRDCLSKYNPAEYYDVLIRAKHRFELIPPTWLGY